MHWFEHFDLWMHHSLSQASKLSITWASLEIFIGTFIAPSQMYANAVETLINSNNCIG